MSERIGMDLSKLPTYGFGSASTAFWGTAGFMLIEGTGFALAIATYLYLASIAETWPPGVGLPNPVWGSAVLVILLISAVPNQIIKRRAREEDLPKVRLHLIVMSLFGLAAIAFRILEFRVLAVRWDQNAYGSIVWAILGLHLTHLVTDVADTLVLTVLMFTKHARGKRFSDTDDNAAYWDFVVASWIPLYLLIYWFPRFVHA